MDLYPLLFPAGLALLVSISWRLKKSAQPLRLELATRGEAVLADPHMPAAVKDYVRMLLRTAFGMRTFLIGAIVFLPFASLAIIAFPRLLTDATNELSIADPAKRAEFRDLSRLHDRITLANNPLLFGAFLLEAAVLLPFVAMVITIIRGTTLPDGDTDIVMRAFQKQRRHLHKIQWKAA